VAGTVHAKARTILASIPVVSIRPNPEQPRRHFDPEKLEELAASIRARGILHPIIVKREGAAYMVMAGERRFRAAQLAGLDAVPALIRDDDPLEIAIIENLQRENLSPLEEAEGLGALSDQYGYTHDALADLIGKSRPYVSNTLALRRLPGHIKNEYYEKPDVSREILISVARAPSPERQELLWRLAKIRRLSVQRFRAQQIGRPEAENEITELARLLRRLGRKLRALDAAPLPSKQTEQVARLLARSQARIARSLAALSSASSV
jgi:ParB family chromosome partitioning protein